MPELLGLGALQGGLGLISGGINYGINQSLMKYSYDLNEAAAKNADKRQRALYNDFMSPSARIRMLKEAGLSPSLYADGAGAGSMGMTQGAQGAGAGSAVGTMFETANMAEIMKIQSEARLNNAEADKLEGKNAEGEANIAKLWADAGLSKAYKGLTEAKTKSENIAVEIADATKSFNISRIKSESQKAADEATSAYWDAERKGLEWQFELQTFEDRANLIGGQVAELAARTAEEYSKAKLNDEERKNIKNYVKISLMEALAKCESASDYAKYVDGYLENLPKQIELRKDEISTEKWRIGVNAATELIRSGAYVYGASKFGSAGYTMKEETTEYDIYGQPHAKQSKTKHKVPNPNQRM